MPVFVLANVYIPFSIGPSCGMILLLIPVIMMEAAVFRDTTDKTMPYKTALKPVALANVVTALVGVPLAIPFYGWEMHTMFGMDAGDVSKRIGLLQYGLVIPWAVWGLSFLMSFLIERAIILRWFRSTEHPTPLLKQGVWLANAVTYALLAVPNLLSSLLGLGGLFSSN